jgi:DNA invertase Pin-like site-specific DNA recombinase
MDNITTIEVTPKGRGGRKTKADRQALQESSYTYKPDAHIHAQGNPNGAVLILNRLSMKHAASEGDKAQRQENIEFAKKNGYDLTKIEEIWEVGSAWKKGKWRPLIDNIINRMKNREIAAIICYEISRLTRDPQVAKLIQQVAQTYNVPIRFVKSPSLHPEKTDSVNEIMYVVFVQQASEESQSTSDRTKRNHKFRASQGRKRGGSDPMGLRTIKIAPEDHAFTELAENTTGNFWRVFAPNFTPRADYPKEMPSEADVVKFMFQCVLDGVGYSKIPAKLEALNIPTFGSDKWHRLTVRRILNNPVYAGFGTYLGEISYDQKGEPIIGHKALISIEDWHKVQELLKAKSKDLAPAKDYRLSGTIKCALCGASMYGKAQRKRHGDGLKNSRKIQAPIYLCSNYTSSSTSCKANSITMNNIDKLFYDLLTKFIKNNGNIGVKLSDKTFENALLTDINELNNKISKMKQMIELEEDSDAKEAFGDRLNKLNNDLSMLMARKEIVIDNDQEIEFSEKDLDDAWENDPIKVQRMIKTIFKAIHINQIAKGDQPLNQFQLSKLNWICDLRRIDIEFHNGVKVNLASDDILDNIK